MRSSIFIGVVSSFVFTAPVVLASAYFSGPEIQARFFPIIDRLEASAVVYGDGKVCWTQHFHRAREGTPVFLTYSVLTDFGARFPVAPYRADGKRIFTQYGFAAHAPGTSWEAPYCFNIPSALDASQAFLVEGEITFDAPLMPWRVTQPMSRFYVPPAAQVDGAASPRAGGSRLARLRAMGVE